MKGFRAKVERDMIVHTKKNEEFNISDKKVSTKVLKNSEDSEWKMFKLQEQRLFITKKQNGTGMPKHLELRVFKKKLDRQKSDKLTKSIF